MDGLEQPLQRGRSRFRYSLPTSPHGALLADATYARLRRLGMPINESRINIWWSRIANPNIRD